MRNYKQLDIPRSAWQNPLHFIAFGFGSGTVPFAPGTFGTFMAVPFYLAIRPLPSTMYFLVALIISLASIWICHKVSQELNVHDHPGMCLDEFVGFFVTMFNAPQGIGWIVWGIVLFRLFDILKPWPVNYIDKKIKGGIGMVLDDIVAGLYSLIILHFFSWIF